MLEILFWSLIVVTWITVGMHVVKEFIRFKYKIDKSNFNFNQISKLYYYKSKRWDIETVKGNIIKLPIENIGKSLDLFIRLSRDNKFKDSSIIDFRQKNQIILNEK